MASSAFRLTDGSLPASREPLSAHFNLHLKDLAPRSPEREVLRHALARALLCEPHPGTSLLREVEHASSRVVARFERGDGTLEQQLRSGSRGSHVLPLPFLRSVRMVSEAAAALNDHAQGRHASLSAFSPRTVMTVCGEPRLNAALLEPAPRSGPERPSALAVASLLAVCLGGGDATRRLAQRRPLLPTVVVQFVDGARRRALAGSGWLDECGLLDEQVRRIQSRAFVSPALSERPLSEVVLQQLSLLPVLHWLEGALAVDTYFAEQCQRRHAQIEEFRSAFARWRSERRLLGLLAPVSVALPEAQLRRDSETRARIAQARFEFQRRDANAGLLLALDAALMDPASPEVWLALAEMRGDSGAGARALCLSEAICASRGDARVLRLVRGQLGMNSDRQLAGYFRAYGDHVLADWFLAGSCEQAAMRQVH